MPVKELAEELFDSLSDFFDTSEMRHHDKTQLKATISSQLQKAYDEGQEDASEDAPDCDSCEEKMPDEPMRDESRD